MKPLKYLAAAALSMATAPVVAAPNPAASLSIAAPARAAAPAHHHADLTGAYGGYVAAGALLVVLVTIFIVVQHDDKPRSP